MLFFLFIYFYLFDYLLIYIKFINFSSKVELQIN